MAVRLPTLRHALRQPSLNPRFTQRRWAQVQDVRLLATHDAQARILAKYKAKLEAKAKAQGLKDLEELKEQYKDKIHELRKQAIVPGATGPLTPPPTPSSSPTPSPPSPPRKPPTPNSPWPSPQQPHPPPPGIKTLASFLDVPKLLALPAPEVQTLWHLRHASTPQAIHFSLPAPTFATLLRTAKQHPAFVLPVPREMRDGEAGGAQTAAELHYLQFAHPHLDTTTLMFTTLAEFKVRGEFASPHTTVTFHRELVGSHGLVLGQGVVVEGRGVSVEDARWLVMCMQKFYVQGEEGKGRGELLTMFTRGDGAFRVQRLIDEAEKIL